MKIIRPLIISSLALGSLFYLSGCGAPDITTFTMSGPERSLVQLTGDIALASVVWDVGTPDERTIPSGFVGASFFSVPPGATVGNHSFRLERSGSSSATMTFNVTAPVPITPPRLDYITLANSEFKPGNLVNCLVVVQGANVDAGAEILMDGVAMGTMSLKALRNDLFGINPATLDFPIYHFVALLGSTGDLPITSVHTFQIRNLDGQLSSVVNYTLPTSQATVDSDGDNLPDVWERGGYDSNNDGTVDINLNALGAHPFRRDLFLEVDIMNSLANPPANAVFTTMQSAFANAPILNPFTPNGINLVIDHSGTVPYWDDIDMVAASDPSIGYINFYDLKATNFNDALRGRIYQYAIWGNMRRNNSSGVSDPSEGGGDFTGPGDDLIVSFDDFSAPYQTVRSGAETLMHEFGHNMMQRHGGFVHFSNLPCYNSVMSYSWQMRTALSDANRRSRAVCAPLYYNQTGAVEANGAVFATTGIIISYSDGMSRALTENNLDEPAGVCNGIANNWNGDADATDAAVARDLNGDGDTADTWRDYCNWCNLDFRGPQLNGAN